MAIELKDAVSLVSIFGGGYKAVTWLRAKFDEAIDHRIAESNRRSDEQHRLTMDELAVALTKLSLLEKVIGRTERGMEIVGANQLGIREELAEVKGQIKKAEAAYREVIRSQVREIAPDTVRVSERKS